MDSQAVAVGAGGPPRLLVIEDEAYDREMIERRLRRVDASVRLVFAPTLARAREVLQIGGVGAVLLDNALPDGDGVDFAVEIKANPNYAELPLFILSGWPSPFMLEKAQAARVRDVIKKDSFTDDLASIVTAAMVHPRGGWASSPRSVLPV